MASFKDWALQYVLSDNESAQRVIVEKAAKGKQIESSRANSTVLGNWAASVHQWLSTASAKDEDLVDDGEEGDDGSGDIIARAKALGFLAGTLEELDQSTLKTDQVRFLVGFFGSMFSYDHKAGITAAAKALRQLYSMKNFKPDMGVKMVDDVCKIKEDFRLQTASTRFEIYELFLSLLQDESVNSELQHKYGSSQGFVVDLLQICQAERDPKNLMVWFKILAGILANYSPSTEVTEEIFKAFSVYFPISVRASAAPTGITAEDLKGAVRSCFSAHQRLAPIAFPFLIQKLDQGDAITVAVKVDILRTIKACIDSYDHPQTSIVPYIEKIWNSLKYEVRNGEVKETIDATLDVLRAVAQKLDGTKTTKLDPSMLKNYFDLVFKDCRDDLSNPTYTKQAGLLLVTVITANVRAFVLESATLIDCIRQNLRQPKSSTHTRDLILLLNSLLKARQELITNRTQGHPEDEQQLRSESRAHLDSLFHDVYLPIWVDKASEPDSETVDVLRKVIQGLALLVRQQVLGSDGEASLLCSRAVCSEICSLLTQSLIKGLALSSNDNATTDTALEDEAVLAFRTVVMRYTDGYAEFATRAAAEIRKRDWGTPSGYSLNALRDLLSRLAFIGCSEIPVRIATDRPPQTPFSPLQHFITLTATLLGLFPLSSPPGSARFASSSKEPLANCYIISALHGGMLHFCDACGSKYTQEVLVTYSGSETNWIEEFNSLPEDWLQQLRQGGRVPKDRTLCSVAEDDPEVYRQFLRLSLFIVRNLYRAASAGTQVPWSERVLAQVSSIAALVVRAIDEKLQVSCGLAAAAFSFFQPTEAWDKEKDPVQLKELLTVGILEGLWPGAMVDLYQPGGLAEGFMCDTAHLGPIPSRLSEIRAAIGAILANKHKGGPSTSDPQSETIKRVLDFWGNQMKIATTSNDIDTTTFGELNKISMYILAGATARQDKNVLGLVPVLHAAIRSQHQNGEIIAQSLGILVKDNDLLSTENHAVVKRFYKQWAYNYLAKPLYELALPTKTEAWQAARYSTAVLSVVSNCPFKVYEDDLEPLIRLLITTLNNRFNLSRQVSLVHRVSALETLVEILMNEPDSIKGHLKAIISGAVNVHQDASQEREEKFKDLVKGAPRNNDLHLVMCRRLVLQLLGGIPTKFEERHLLPYTLQMKRMLATASGDPVREVRKTALLARETWAKIAV
ncbi:Dos2-interacting transcription regulator of RNA-Pol-II-domain-containing protein [Apodospora peruviana]|uniref:MMS19 nucleotide excision repair protein n=1 Tax=Apodospora peruviana TaxID=516989 RepID=A0AAE0MGT3_9PEZI|nr:Dos2-interacting transcription regulator of RNA-Pol-II-domain-containing protein [Apodospora peruviana]